MDQSQAWFHMVAYLIDRGWQAQLIIFQVVSEIWYPSVFLHIYFIKSITISCTSQKM